MVAMLRNKIFFLLLFLFLKLENSNAEDKIEGLYWSGDTFVGPIESYLDLNKLSPYVLDFKKSDHWFVAETFESLVSPIMTGIKKPAFFTVSPPYVGDLAKSNSIEKMSKYFDKLPVEVKNNYYSDLIGVYKDFYGQYEGHQYCLPIDGDVLLLHYRPSFFKRPDLKKKYFKKYGKSLQVPNTWEEYDQISKFFTEELKGNGVYGSYTFGIDPWVWAFWYARAANQGVRLFDDEMKPLINSDQAVKSLKEYVKQLDWSYPTIDDLSGGAAVDAWKKGRLAMVIWWSDLSELSYQGWQTKDDFDYALLPGKLRKDGKIERYGQVPYGRVACINSLAPEESKQKIFDMLFDFATSKTSRKYISDPRTGLDPFLKSDLEDFESYQKNAKKFGSPLSYPGKAKSLLTATKKSLEQVVPQPDWPGSQRYLSVLGIEVRKAVLKQVTPEVALQNVEKEWLLIQSKLGIAEQKKYWNEYLKKSSKYIQE